MKWVGWWLCGGGGEGGKRRLRAAATMAIASLFSFSLLSFFSLSLSLSLFQILLTSADAGAPAVVEGIVPRGRSGAANSRPSAASSSAALRLSLF